MRLTVSRYFTPSGRCIQRDYKNGQEYDKESERRLKNGELGDESKIQQGDTTKYYTGQGRVVFGGGGITPDVFIPVDTTFSSKYFSDVRQEIPQFISRWRETHDRATLPATLAEFVQKYTISDQMLEDLATYAENHGTPKNPGDLAKSRAELKLQLKARLAKTLFGDEGLFRVLNDDDPAVDKAIQVLKSGQPVAKR
jgi:carboxyl-terminal processing protease